MKNLNAYLSFNGNCREAMTFYNICIGGHLIVNEVGEGQMETSKEDKNKVLHAVLTHETFELMASDVMAGQPYLQGTNVSLSINCSTAEEAEKLFHSLGNGGNVTMPMQETFWGAYFGMLTDKFGINWLFNYDKNA
ncbi:MAG: VOC family protein [Bacteroidia bacterium]|nr:VOC family protein [Bacteroidia bacterium]